MDRSYIAGIEGGNRNPSLKALKQLADGFGITIRDLFT
jgi:transcriptional regulator with XRE-family HTH domain